MNPFKSAYVSCRLATSLRGVRESVRFRTPHFAHNSSVRWVFLGALGADLGVVVHREWIDDGEDSRLSKETEIHVKKVQFRWVGRPGVATLTYDPRTGGYK